MELLTRLNIGIPIEYFELDPDDDFIRRQTGCAIDITALTLEDIRPLIYANVFLTETYVLAFREVVGGANP